VHFFGLCCIIVSQCTVQKIFKKVFILIDIVNILRFFNFGFQYITASTDIEILHKEMSTF